MIGWRNFLLAGAICSLCVLATAGQAADVKLALLQPRTIFHSGLPRHHIIALTFDDGPNAHTEALLTSLRRLHVKATFFIVGRMAHAHPDVLGEIARDGHLLANHSATHPKLDQRFDDNPQLLIQQLRDVDNQIAPLMQPSDKFYFRAPYGYWKSAHAAILNGDPELNKYVGPIYWDAGGEISMRDGYVMSAADWQCWRKGWPAKTCAKGYLREIRRNDGGVVLIHCTFAQAASLVENIVPALQEEGYRFVRLDEVPAYQQYETPPDRRVASLPNDGARRLLRLATSSEQERNEQLSQRRASPLSNGLDRAIAAPAFALLFAAWPIAAGADEGMWTFDNFPLAAVNQKYATHLDQLWLDHVRLAAVRLSSGCSASP